MAVAEWGDDGDMQGAKVDCVASVERPDVDAESTIGAR
jgi:hypothetical protein